MSLGIGNGFAELAQLAVVRADARGLAELRLTIPPALERGTTIWFQAVTFDPTKPVRPFEVSNVAKMLVGF